MINENQPTIKTRKRPRRRNRYKPAIQSKTIITAIVIIIINLTGLAGWAVDAEQVTAAVTSLVTITSAAYVIWRRFDTRARIRGLLTASKTKKNQQT